MLHELNPIKRRDKQADVCCPEQCIYARTYTQMPLCVTWGGQANCTSSTLLNAEKNTQTAKRAIYVGIYVSIKNKQTIKHVQPHVKTQSEKRVRKNGLHTPWQ